MSKKIVLGTKCSLCRKKENNYRNILSTTNDEYRLCEPCYCHYNSLDGNGRYYLQREHMNVVGDTNG